MKQRQGGAEREGGGADRIGGEEVERGRKSEGDERLVEVAGAVLQVPRIRERAPVAARTSEFRTKPRRTGERRIHREGGSGGAHLMPACDGGGCRYCDEACIEKEYVSRVVGEREDAGSGGVGGLGFYPEVEARRRGHPRRARGVREGERSGS